MVKEKLLNKELECYKERNTPLHNIHYNKDIIPDLFKKFKYYGMTESSYCCYGEENCCWQEVVEEGIWDLTLEDVRLDIERNIHYMKRHLYKGKRIYIYQDNEKCYIYIYGRDVIKVDYHIWFSNEEL